MLGKSALECKLGLPDDEGSDIGKTFFGDTVASFVDVITGNAADGICDAQNIGAVDTDFIFFAFHTIEDHHFTRFARRGIPNGRAADGNGFVKGGLGGKVRSASLGEIQLNGTNLATEFILDGKLKRFALTDLLLLVLFWVAVFYIATSAQDPFLYFQF